MCKELPKGGSRASAELRMRRIWFSSARIAITRVRSMEIEGDSEVDERQGRLARIQRSQVRWPGWMRHATPNRTQRAHDDDARTDDFETRPTATRGGIIKSYMTHEQRRMDIGRRPTPRERREHFISSGRRSGGEGDCQETYANTELKAKQSTNKQERLSGGTRAHEKRNGNMNCGNNQRYGGIVIRWER